MNMRLKPMTSKDVGKLNSFSTVGDETVDQYHEIEGDIGEQRRIPGINEVHIDAELSILNKNN